ncbi:hypothetical protein PHLGIDRAFT_152279 [Phlebiopsis gigantea 11061_1 CR5-6]|uniref:Uncharacterized protein n=1 Tax=Phlebiopsis gigantea (strain 11061_1 CR5-6) TaxID=745531 RepID=A0A0C3S8K6_PHLG1|nr:hypothetical protein PHLGIDRAFT_152279 [Phlebiopsis gigantea 11061_1 CR5-6]
MSSGLHSRCELGALNAVIPLRYLHIECKLPIPTLKPLTSECSDDIARKTTFSGLNRARLVLLRSSTRVRGQPQLPETLRLPFCKDKRVVFGSAVYLQKARTHRRAQYRRSSSTNTPALQHPSTRHQAPMKPTIASIHVALLAASGSVASPASPQVPTAADAPSRSPPPSTGTSRPSSSRTSRARRLRVSTGNVALPLPRDGTSIVFSHVTAAVGAASAGNCVLPRDVPSIELSRSPPAVPSTRSSRRSAASASRQACVQVGRRACVSR